MIAESVPFGFCTLDVLHMPLFILILTLPLFRHWFVLLMPALLPIVFVFSVPTLPGFLVFLISDCFKVSFLCFDAGYRHRLRFFQPLDTTYTPFYEEENIICGVNRSKPINQKIFFLLRNFSWLHTKPPEVLSQHFQKFFFPMLLYFAITSSFTAQISQECIVGNWVRSTTSCISNSGFFSSTVWTRPRRHPGHSCSLQQTHLFWILDISCFAKWTGFIINAISANQQPLALGIKKNSHVWVYAVAQELGEEDRIAETSQ